MSDDSTTDSGAAGLGMPVEMARQSLIDDPETKKIADSFGMELEDYVDQVMEYALNPDKEPQLQVMADDDFREMGIDPPAMEDVEQWFADVASGKVKVDMAPTAGSQSLDDSVKKGLDAAEVARRRTTGSEAEPLMAGHVESRKGEVKARSQSGAALAKQVLAQQMRGQMTAGPRQGTARAGASSRGDGKKRAGGSNRGAPRKRAGGSKPRSGGPRRGAPRKGRP